MYAYVYGIVIVFLVNVYYENIPVLLCFYFTRKRVGILMTLLKETPTAHASTDICE